MIMAHFECYGTRSEGSIDKGYSITCRTASSTWDFRSYSHASCNQHNSIASLHQ